MEGYSPAIIIDGKDPTTGELRIRVDSPAGRSDARLTPSGQISLSVEGAEAGRKSEPWTVKTLRTALAERGIGVSLVSAADQRGEDAVFRIGTADYVVQVATTPGGPDFWRDASHSSAMTQVELQQGVEWIRSTVKEKCLCIPKAQRPATILVVDARHVGVLATVPVAASYCSQFSSPRSEYGLASAWVVGPTSRYCVRLGDGVP